MLDRDPPRNPRGLCLVSHEYPPETGRGGIGSYCASLARGLAQAGQRVFVIAGCAAGPLVQASAGVEVHRVKFRPSRLRPGHLFWRAARPLLKRLAPELYGRLEFGLAAAQRLGELRRRRPIHLVEVPEYFGAAWFLERLRRRPPVVVKLHTPTEVVRRINGLPLTLESRLCTFFEKASVRRADLVCAPSRRIGELLREQWLPGLPEPELLEYPIDTELFSPGPAPPGPRVLLFTGRLERRKGVDLLARAFAAVAGAHPDLELHLAGADTPTFGPGVPFHEHLGELGLAPKTLGRIRLLGPRDPAELPALYRSAYACVIPSLAFENFPNSCLEAMACGRPVLVTDAGGTVEMAPHGVAGLHVKAGDRAALAQALDRLAANPAEAEALGQGARQVVMERYAMQVMTGRILEAYERLIRKAGSG